jgi:hypothetical protein
VIFSFIGQFRNYSNFQMNDQYQTRCKALTKVCSGFVLISLRRFFPPANCGLAEPVFFTAAFSQGGKLSLVSVHFSVFFPLAYRSGVGESGSKTTQKNLQTPVKTINSSMFGSLDYLIL